MKNYVIITVLILVIQYHVNLTEQKPQTLIMTAWGQIIFYAGDQCPSPSTSTSLGEGRGEADYRTGFWSIRSRCIVWSRAWLCTTVYWWITHNKRHGITIWTTNDNRNRFICNDRPKDLGLNGQKVEKYPNLEPLLLARSIVVQSAIQIKRRGKLRNSLLSL